MKEATKLFLKKVDRLFIDYLTITPIVITLSDLMSCHYVNIVCIPNANLNFILHYCSIKNSFNAITVEVE